jgi:hypothetical protein
LEYQLERSVVWIPMDGAFVNRPQKLIGVNSIKQMVVLLIVAPARTMSPLARTGAPNNDTVNDYCAG